MTKSNRLLHTISLLTVILVGLCPVQDLNSQDVGALNGGGRTERVDLFASSPTPQGADSSATSQLSSSVDQYTGQHTESFPLFGISSRNSELSIGLSLSYNGNIREVLTAENFRMQTSSVGLGFHLSYGFERIIAEHKGTQTLFDDEYLLYVNGSQIRLIRISGDNFVPANGEPWKITRTIGNNGITGWTVIVNSGTIYKFGDFTDISANYNATCNLLRYGTFVGGGVDQTDEVFNFRWELSEITDAEGINQILVEYIREDEYLTVRDAAGTNTVNSNNTYTRNLLPSRFISDNGAEILLTYYSRDDWRADFEPNEYVKYSTLRLASVTSFFKGSRTGELQLFHSYLNAPNTAEFIGKLLLDSLVSVGVSTDSVLPPHKFEYISTWIQWPFFTTPDDGKLSTITYPNGSIKKVYFADAPSNFTQLETVSTATEDWFKGQYFINTGAGNPRLYAWNGYWHESPAEYIGNFSGTYRDKPSVSREGWIAVLDRTDPNSTNVIVKRWMSGYWRTEIPAYQIQVASNERMIIQNGGYSSFLAFVMTYESVFPIPLPSTFRYKVKSVHYYQWNGEKWLGFLVVNEPTPKWELDQALFNGSVFGFNYHEPKNEAGNEFGNAAIFVGKYDAETENISVYVDGSLTNNGIGGKWIVGQNMFGYIYNFVLGPHLKTYRWNEMTKQWEGGELASYGSNVDLEAIAPLRNGFLWTGHVNTGGNNWIASNFFNNAGGFTPSVVVAIDPVSADVNALSLSPAKNVFFASYRYPRVSEGAAILLETGLWGWNGLTWDRHPTYEHALEPAGFNDILYRSSSNANNSGVFKGTFTDWTDPRTVALGGYTGTIAGFYGWHVGGGGIDVDNYIAVDKYSLLMKETHYEIAQMGSYQGLGGTYGLQIGPTFDPSVVGYASDTLRVTNEAFVLRPDNLYWKILEGTYRLIRNEWEGNMTMRVVNKVELYRHKDDTDPIVQTFDYYGGLCTPGGGSPAFARTTVSEPYYLSQESQPKQYSVSERYNDINKTGFYDQSVYSDMEFPDLEDGALYDTTNGGYHLDGREYCKYSFQDNGSVITYNSDSVLFFHSVHSTMDSLRDVRWIRMDSTFRQRDGVEIRAHYLYNEENQQRASTRTIIADDPLTIRSERVDSVEFAYSNDPNMESDNALTQVEVSSQFEYEYDYVSQMETYRLINRTEQVWEKHGYWKQSQQTSTVDPIHYDCLNSWEGSIFADGGVTQSQNFNATNTIIYYELWATSGCLSEASITTPDTVITVNGGDPPASGYLNTQIGATITLYVSSDPGACFSSAKFTSCATETGRPEREITSFSALEWDAYGNMIALQDAIGAVSGSIFDSDSAQVIADIQGANPSSCILMDFEYGPLRGLYIPNWINDQGTSDTTSFTGDSSYFISGATGVDVTGPTGKISATSGVWPTDSLYLSFWAKGSFKGYVHVIEWGTDNGVDRSSSIIYVFYPSISAWNQFDDVISLDGLNSQYPQAIPDSVQVVLFRAGDDNGQSAQTTDYVIYDDLRVLPVDAIMTTRVFDPETNAMTSGSNAQNVPLRFEYDNFLRPMKQSDYLGNTVSTNRYITYDSVRADTTYSPGVGTITLCPVNWDHSIFSDGGVTNSEMFTSTASTIYYKLWTSSSPCVNEARISVPGTTISVFQDDPVSEGYLTMNTGDPITLYVSSSSGACFAGAEFKYCEETPVVDTIVNITNMYVPEYIRTTSYRSVNDSSVTVVYTDGFGNDIQVRTTSVDESGSASVLVLATEYDSRGRVTKQYKPYYDSNAFNSVAAYDDPVIVALDVNAYYDGSPGPDCLGSPFTESAYEVDLQGRISEVMPEGSFRPYSVKYGYGTNDTPLLDKNGVVRYPDSTLFRSTVTFPVSGVSEDPGTVWREVVTASTYTDLLGRNVAIVRDTGGADAKTHFYPDFNGNDTLIVQPEGHEIRKEFNNLSWLLIDSGGDYGLITSQYDDAGRMRFQASDENASRVYTTGVPAVTYYGMFQFFNYDNLGRLTHNGFLYDTSLMITTNANDQAFPDTVGRDIVYNTFTYGSTGFSQGLLTRTNTYPEANNAITPALNHNSVDYFGYDALGNLTYKSQDISWLEWGQKIMTAEYDLQGNVTKLTYPNSKVVNYVYNDGGQLERIHDYDGVDITLNMSFNYWPSGNVKSKSLGSGVTPAQVVDYQYNERGWLTSINNGQVSGSSTGAGDHFGLNLTYQSGAWENCAAFDFENGCISPNGPTGYYNGNISSYQAVTSPNTNLGVMNQSFIYDSLGRMSGYQIDASSDFNRTINYDLNGRIMQISDGSLLPEYYTFYNSGNNNRIDSAGAFGQTGNTAFTYNNSGSMLWHGNIENRYDYFDRLIERNQPYVYGPFVVNYWYNSNGQRLVKKSTWTYRYPCWDPCGAGCYKDDPGGPSASLDEGFNGASNPVFAANFTVPTTPGGWSWSPWLDGTTGEIRFKEDWNLGRMWYTVPLGGGEPPPPAYCYADNEPHVAYYYFGGNMLCDYYGDSVSATENLITNYVYANGERVASFTEDALPDYVRYYLTDHLGSVVGIVKDNGDLTNKYQYLPYGELHSAYVIDNNKYGYTGQESETELSTEWTYHGARYYDATFKMFTQVDPLAGKYPSWSPYHYSANNPMNVVDLNGEDWYTQSDGYYGYDNDFIGPRQGEFFADDIYYEYGSATYSNGGFSFSRERIDPNVQSFIPFADDDFNSVRSNVRSRFELLSNFQSSLYNPRTSFLLPFYLSTFALNVGAYSDVDLKRNSSTVFDQRFRDPSSRELQFHPTSYVSQGGEFIHAWDAGNILGGEMARVAGIPWSVAARGAGVADILGRDQKSFINDFRPPLFGDEAVDFYFNRRGYFGQ